MVQFLLYIFYRLICVECVANILSGQLFNVVQLFVGELGYAVCVDSVGHVIVSWSSLGQ